MKLKLYPQTILNILILAVWLSVILIYPINCRHENYKKRRSVTLFVDGATFLMRPRMPSSTQVDKTSYCRLWEKTAMQRSIGEHSVNMLHFGEANNNETGAALEPTAVILDHAEKLH